MTGVQTCALPICFILFFCGQVGSSKQSLWSPEIKILSLDSVYDNVLLRRITLFPFHLFHIIFFLFQMVMVPFFLIFSQMFFNFFSERFFACFIISHSWHGLLHSFILLFLILSLFYISITLQWLAFIMAHFEIVFFGIRHWYFFHPYSCLVYHIYLLINLHNNNLFFLGLCRFGNSIWIYCTVRRGIPFRWVYPCPSLFSFLSFFYTFLSLHHSSSFLPFYWNILYLFY